MKSKILIICVLYSVRGDLNSPYSANSQLFQYQNSAPASFNKYSAFASGWENQDNRANYKRYPEHIPVIKNGVPVETPEVQAAKYAHFEAYNRAALEAAQSVDKTVYQPIQQLSSNYDRAYNSKTSHHHVFKRSIAAESTEDQYEQLEGQNGDNPTSNFEIAVKDEEDIGISNQVGTENTKQDSNANAPFDNQYKEWLYQNDGSEQALTENTLTSHVQLAPTDREYQIVQIQNKENIYSNPQHVPTIGKNGVPIDTKEVQEARNQHLLAHALAKSNGFTSGQYGGSLENQHGLGGFQQYSGVGLDSDVGKFYPVNQMRNTYQDQQLNLWKQGGSYSYGAVAGYNGDSYSHTNRQENSQKSISHITNVVRHDDHLARFHTKNY